MTGAQFFSSLLSSNDNNVLLATGMYNGWKKGLTIVSPTGSLLMIAILMVLFSRVRQLRQQTLTAALAKTTSISESGLFCSMDVLLTTIGSLTQTLNGWLQNRDPSASPRIGQYFNLDQCNR